MSKDLRVAVIGLGHFGLRLALELTRSGVEVLAIDKNEKTAEEARDKVAHVAIVDTSDEVALKELGINDFDVAAVCIGDDFQGSLLTVAHLQNLRVKKIIGRAVNPAHERILKQMKVDQIILPEASAAFNLSKQIYLTGVTDAIDISKEYSILVASPPSWTHNRKLSDIDLRKQYSIEVITIIEGSDENRMLTLGDIAENSSVMGAVNGETRIEKTARLLLFGKTKHLKNFLNQES